MFNTLNRGVGSYERRGRRTATRVAAGVSALLLAGALSAGCKDEGQAASHGSGHGRPAATHKPKPQPKPKHQGGGIRRENFRCTGINFKDNGKSGTWSPKLSGSPRPQKMWIEGKVFTDIAHAGNTHKYSTETTGALSITESPDAPVTNVTMKVKWRTPRGNTLGSACNQWIQTSRLFGLGEPGAADTAPEATSIALPVPHLAQLGELAMLTAPAGPLQDALAGRAQRPVTATAPF